MRRTGSRPSWTAASELEQIPRRAQSVRKAAGKREGPPLWGPFLYSDWELRSLDSNQGPSGYEPDELPLLHSAFKVYRRA
jgi:hypothetical protein